MKKKIVLYIPSIEGGGVEKNFFLITNYLSKKYKKIFIVTADMNTKNQSSKHVVTNLIKILKEQIALNGNILCLHQDLAKNLNLGNMAM